MDVFMDMYLNICRFISIFILVDFMKNDEFFIIEFFLIFYYIFIRLCI